MGYEELMKKLNELDNKSKDDLFSKVKDWALMHGIGMRQRNNYDPNSLTIAPFTLFPSVISKSAFEKAIAAQTSLNYLLHRLAYDPHFLQEALSKTIEHDDFTRRLFEIYTIVRKEGLSQTFSLGLLRSDYLPDSDGSLKQVEMNTIASSMAGLISSVELIHRFVLKEMNLEHHLQNLPENPSLSNLCLGLIEAWKFFNVEKSVILFVVEDVTYNICDQRFMEFEIGRLERRVKVIRRSFAQLVNEATLGNNMELFVGNKQVAVVYFRYGYDPNQYTEDFWSVRLLMERSSAIKCPSIHYHLVGTKKVQQVLCENGVLEKYLNDPHDIRLIREMFVDIYPLDKSDEGEKGYKLAMTEPEKYVMKPQREGGGNNVYGKDIPSHLAAMSRDDASSWILMKLIQPSPSPNVLVRPSSTSDAHIVSELGIYGIVIGNDKEILVNNVAGHMLRSKLSTANEGGVAAGDGALDSPYLVS